MFPFSCTTCEAKLIVKDEKLVGKIVACPKCSSMVLIQPPDDAPTPSVAPRKSGPHKRFPDVLTHETPSGVIGHTSRENRRAENFLEVVHAEPHVSETEVKTRKILIGILIGLLVFFLVVVGFLMIFQGQERPQPQEPLPPPVIQNPIEPLLPEDPPIEPAPLEPVDNIDIAPPPVEGLPEVLPQDMPIEPDLSEDISPPLLPNDTLSAIEQRMPGFVDVSVPNIDIDARLALPIDELNFDQAKLIDFVRVLSRMTEIPMTLDIDEMRPRALSARTPVSGQFSDATADEILTETLATVGLQWIAVDRQILIFPANIADTADLTFDVSDLAERTDDLTPEVLAEMVQRLVVPDANVAVLSNNRLAVVQNENNRKSQTRQRDEVLRFLEQLRAVRQLPQRTEWAGETLAPEAFGWDWVMMPMTLNHYRPVPISRILAQVEEWTGLTIIVDHQSLHRALTPFSAVQATMLCDQGTVNDVLELSLASVDLVALAYRIVDHHTFEITTMESARQPEKMVMEVHRYELQEDETPEDIVRALRSAVFPDSWVVLEFPETHYGGYIVIDHSSNCLFVRQSQPAQRQIRLFLSVTELFEDEELLEP